MALLDRFSLRSGASKRLRVRWSEAWGAEHDEALAVLPEIETCSRDVFRALARCASPARKRYAVVSEADAPVALVALRWRGRRWEPVGEGVVPRAIAAAQPGRLIDSLAALGVHIRINGWEGPLPAQRAVRGAQSVPVFRIPANTDWDAFWRATGNTDRVRKARNRSARLGDVAMELDGPGAAEWIITNWQHQWADDPEQETVVAPDLLTVTPMLRDEGRLRTVRLLVDGTPVAGVNWFVRGDTLIAQTGYYDRAYASAGVGVRLDELFYRWVSTTAYRTIDLGGVHEYKAKWAVEDGARASFSVCPPHLAALDSGIALARSMARRSRALAARLSLARGRRPASEGPSG
jgi:hypothetical protein